MPVIIMPTNNGPISEEARQALKGVFVILNAIFIIINLCMGAYLVRKKEEIINNLFGVLTDYDGVFLFNWIILIIDL